MQTLGGSKKSLPVSGLNKRCQRCEGATNSQIRSGQNELFCPLLASGMLSLTITRLLAPEPRLGAKTTLHYNSFGLLKMCPCISCTGAHLTLSKNPFHPPREEVGNPAWVKNPLPVLSICKLIQQKCAPRLGQRFSEKVTQIGGCALFCDLYRPCCHCFPRSVVTDTCMLFLQC